MYEKLPNLDHSRDRWERRTDHRHCDDDRHSVVDTVDATRR